MGDEKKKSAVKMEILPEEENIKVIDMKLGPIFLGILGCATLAGVAYTYYTHIKTRSEEKWIQAISSAISVVVGEIVKVLPTGTSDDNEIKITAVDRKNGQAKRKVEKV